MREYFLSVAAWISQGINVIVFAGNEDTTVSARAYLERKHSPFWRWMYMNLNRVFGFILRQENHCLDSHLRDVRRASEVASRV